MKITVFCRAHMSSNEKTSLVLSLSIKVMWKVISSWSLQVFVEKSQNDYNNSPITKPKQYIFATLYLIYDTGGIFIEVAQIELQEHMLIFKADSNSKSDYLNPCYLTSIWYQEFLRHQKIANFSMGTKNFQNRFNSGKKQSTTKKWNFLRIYLEFNLFW